MVNHDDALFDDISSMDYIYYNGRSGFEWAGVPDSYCVSNIFNINNVYLIQYILVHAPLLERTHSGPAGQHQTDKVQKRPHTTATLHAVDYVRLAADL